MDYRVTTHEMETSPPQSTQFMDAFPLHNNPQIGMRLNWSPDIGWTQGKTSNPQYIIKQKPSFHLVDADNTNSFSTFNVNEIPLSLFISLSRRIWTIAPILLDMCKYRQDELKLNTPDVHLYCFSCGYLAIGLYAYDDIIQHAKDPEYFRSDPTNGFFRFITNAEKTNHQKTKDYTFINEFLQAWIDRHNLYEAAPIRGKITLK